MTDLRLPCREGNEDDWFLRPDGKQYRDDELLTDDDRLAILEQANDLDLEGQARVDFIEATEDRAEADAKRAALQRRRHAKEACHDCLFRTRCLQLAIDGDEVHGTWGGYYEEEIGEIRKEIRRRNRRRAGLVD